MVVPLKHPDHQEKNTFFDQLKKIPKPHEPLSSTPLTLVVRPLKKYIIHDRERYDKAFLFNHNNFLHGIIA